MSLHQPRNPEIQELRHRSQSAGDLPSATSVIDQSLLALDERLEAVSQGIDAVDGMLVPSQNGLSGGNDDVSERGLLLRVAEKLDANDAPAIVNNFGAGAPAGFVHREQQGLITAYLQESSMLIPPGFQMSLTARAGLWARNRGATEALPGMKAFANFADGSVSFAPAGSISSSSVTGSKSLSDSRHEQRAK